MPASPGALKHDEANRARGSRPYAQWRWTPIETLEVTAGLLRQPAAL